MNEILKTELFSLLAETSLVTNEKMENAYENYVEEVRTLNQSAADFSEIFRVLNFTHIEFKALQAQILCEQGGKCA